MSLMLEVLVIEDNLNNFQLIHECLHEFSYAKFHVSNAQTLAEAKSYLNQHKVDAILLDFELPDSQGIKTFFAINTLTCDCPIIIMVDLENEALAHSAITKGAQDYLLKSDITTQLLSRTILYGIERKHAETQLKELAAIVENSNDAIIGKNLEGIITSWNKGAQRIYGYTAEEAVGQPITMLVPEDHRADVERILAMIKNGERITQYQTARIRKDGSKITVLLSISPIKDKLGQTIEASVIASDITAQILAETRLAIQYRIALALAESISFDDAAHNILKSICEIMDWQIGEIWVVNHATHLLQYGAHWFKKETFNPLEDVSKELNFATGEGLPGYVWEHASSVVMTEFNKPPYCIRQQVLSELGMKSCIGFPIVFQKNIFGIILFFVDTHQQLDINFTDMLAMIGEQLGVFINRKNIERELLYLGQHDALTGLANRAILEGDLNNAIQEAALKQKKIAILYLDLDHFKNINDTMGHAMGDVVLQKLADRLLSCIRPTDTLARFGGDEFIIILTNILTEKDVATVAQKLLALIALPISLNNQEFYITTSIGISLYPDDGQDAQMLLKSADLALYHVKQEGRNNYRFSIPSATIIAQQQIVMENELHRALNNQEFSLYYQPKIDIKSDKVIGVEALIRWEQPDGKMRSPVEFIPIAEETGLIVPIGEWVIRSAFLQAKAWFGKKTPHFSIAINISVYQFNTHLITFVKSMLEELDISPNCIEFEITESTLMQITERNMNLFYQLSELGIKISIDDFGTGYSSFSYLNHFKMDSIKIDRSFIEDIPEDADAAVIIRAIIGMAHTLGIKTIAEGVETQAQLDFLRANDCDEYQGYLFAKPLSAAEIYPLILKNLSTKK